MIKTLDVRGFRNLAAQTISLGERFNVFLPLLLFACAHPIPREAVWTPTCVVDEGKAPAENKLLRAPGEAGCAANGFDFTKHYLAMFRLAPNGGYYEATSLDDDGTTITLSAEFHAYCGGMVRGVHNQTFYFGVPAPPRTLRVKSSSASGSCPRDLP